jgi:hypothetical protein
MDIVITTFESRFEILSKHVDSIRQYVNNKIILVINGEKDAIINEEYRKQVLSICLKYNNIFPYFFPEIRSLSKMWNNGILNSTSENILILNDDLLWSQNLLEELHTNIKFTDTILLLNNSFSHFVLNRNFIYNFGFFDEKFMGFGWEDSDFCERYYNKMGEKPDTFYISSLKDLNSNIKQNGFETTWEKYSTVNKEYFSEKYEFPSAHPYERGKTLIETENPYPLEVYFIKNKKI